MTNKELQLILRTLFREQATKNPYFIFAYNWGIVNFSDKVVTAQEIMQCVNEVVFPPIGKN